MRRLDDTRSPGWVAVTCRNHPSLRWTMKDPREAEGRISQNVQLMFDGDLEQPDKEVWPFHQGDRHEMSAEAVAMYAWECDCPFSDLEPIYPEVPAC